MTPQPLPPAADGPAVPGRSTEQPRNASAAGTSWPAQAAAVTRWLHGIGSRRKLQTPPQLTAGGSPAQPFKLSRYASDGARTQYFTTAGQRDHVAHQLADSTGSVVYTFRWQPTPQSLLLDQGWVPEANIVPGLDDAGYLTISLTVLNMYEKYDDVTTTFTDVRIPAPPDPADQDAYEAWRYEHIQDPFTGVGHPDGDSWYSVTVTACSDPHLVGAEFDFGF